jgi:hypothetical protein
MTIPRGARRVAVDVFVSVRMTQPPALMRMSSSSAPASADGGDVARLATLEGISDARPLRCQSGTRNGTRLP